MSPCTAASYREGEFALLDEADVLTPALLAAASRRIDTFLATHPATEPIKHAIHKPAGYAR